MSSPCCLPSSVLLLPSRGFAPLGLLSCPPPAFVFRGPPAVALCRLVLVRCAGLFCASRSCVAACCVVLFGVRCSVLCGPVVLLAVLCCSGCGGPCRVVPCLVVLRGCCGAALHFLVQLRPAEWSAVLAGAVLCCRALRRSLGCCVLVLCAVLSRCVLLWVVLCRLLSVGVVRLAVCCAVLCLAVLRCAVVCCCVLCCAFGRGFWLRCVVLSSFWLAVSSGRGAVCCAVPPGAVLGRVASSCALWCSAVVHCASGVVLCCVVPRCVVPLRVVACPRVLYGASGAVCFAACCAVLCCAAVFCALPWVVVSWCAVLCCSCCVWLFCRGLCSCASCCVSLCCAAPRCVVLLGAVQCYCALCCLHGAVLVFLALLGAVARCALPSGVVPSRGLLCPLVWRFAVLPCAVCVVLCVLHCCVVVCAGFRCCPWRCWRPVVSRCVRSYLRVFSKAEKLFPANTCCVLWCRAVCSLPSLQAAKPHTEKTSLVNFFLLALLLQ